MHLLPAIWGLVFAAGTIVVHLFFGRDVSILVAAMLMAMIASVYVGFAIIDGRASTIAVEAVMAMAFGFAALGGVLVTPWFLVAALVGHAAWDTLHHRPGLLAATPRWYVPYCAVYDGVAALGLALLWFAPVLR